MEALEKHLQSISLTDGYTQYVQLQRVLPDYDQEFVLFKHDFMVSSKPEKPKLYQATLAQYSTKKVTTAPTPPPPPALLIGTTRTYQARIVLPGFCNNRRLVEQFFDDAPIPPSTPKQEYSQVNVNKLDRQFANQSVIHIYEFSQADWIAMAEKCVRNVRVMQYGFEPLTTYCRYIIESKTNPALEKPNQYGAKLTLEQKTQLLDAFYWVRIKKDPRYELVLFYYKLFGWFVRIKDRYRMLRHPNDRQLYQKRRKLMHTGSLDIQCKPPKTQTKSNRGRKPKINV